MDDSLLLEKDRIENPEKEIPFSNKLKKKLKMNIDTEADNQEVSQKCMLNAVAHAGLAKENLDEFVEEYSNET
jgi:hypothetical protein